jgi:AcrR family transcriptional regulator
MNGRADTKGRILDSAEKLFGMNGFEQTSLRDITADADVNLAAVNYHFHSKDSLIDAVIARRIEPVNDRRLELLEASGPNPTLEQILEAFVGPVLERDPTPISPLLGRILTTPDQFIARVFRKHLAEVVQKFAGAVSKVLPDLSAGERMWRFYFTAGAMANVLTWARLLPEMTGGQCDPTDRKAVTAALVRFAAAGFRASERQP